MWLNRNGRTCIKLLQHSVAIQVIWTSHGTKLRGKIRKHCNTQRSILLELLLQYIHVCYWHLQYLQTSLLRWNGTWDIRTHYCFILVHSYLVIKWCVYSFTLAGSIPCHLRWSLDPPAEVISLPLFNKACQMRKLSSPPLSWSHPFSSVQSDTPGRFWSRHGPLSTAVKPKRGSWMTEVPIQQVKVTLNTSWTWHGAKLPLVFTYFFKAGTVVLYHQELIKYINMWTCYDLLQVCWRERITQLQYIWTNNDKHPEPPQMYETTIFIHFMG